ncbi:hypothetical protein [Terrisporobacter vanillatitrophus]|uniref:hypothetical protein n=1 Tax=Terrisporobacter vanillatitrophus TaxID=3058402 RepID=UPI0033699539
MKIEMFFVYPHMGIVNKESNLFRIVDFNLKETLVIYLMKEKNQYNIYMINTMTGSIEKIFTGKDLDEAEKFNDIFIKKRDNIINGKSLEEIERYILKVIKN